MTDEVTPTCDICGRPEDQDPTNGREYDWNGETGCHQTCEMAVADQQYERDRWIEALLGGRLRFHADPDVNGPAGKGRLRYWSDMYGRWKDLYARNPRVPGGYAYEA